MQTRRSSLKLNLSFRPRYHKPAGRWMRHFALATALIFAWTLVLALPVQALTHQPNPKRTGVRVLNQKEMGKIVGSLTNPTDPGALPWEYVYEYISNTNVNTYNGDKLVMLPIVAWTSRGGLPVDFTLFHHSESVRNVELGNKWSHSYDLYLVPTGDQPPPPAVGNVWIHWGNQTGYTFTKNMDGSYSPPTGIHDSLVHNGDNTFTLTKPDQTQFHFKTNLYCDTIKDENGNTISLAYNGSNNVTSITDPTNRKITLGYDGSGRINSITDPLSRQWSITYDSNNNLWKLSYPVINSTTYQTVLTYNSNHDITGQQDPRGYSWTASYNTNNSVAWEKDPLSNQTSYSYTSTACTVTDPNSNQMAWSYDSSGRNNQFQDPLSNLEKYTWDTNYN